MGVEEDPVVSLSWVVVSVSIVGLLIVPTLSLPSLIVLFTEEISKVNLIGIVNWETFSSFPVLYINANDVYNSLFWYTIIPEQKVTIVNITNSCCGVEGNKSRLVKWICQDQHYWQS